MLGYASTLSAGVGDGEFVSRSAAGWLAEDEAGNADPPHAADSRSSAEQAAVRSEMRGVMRTRWCS
jgi:hypothetical protein